MKYNINHYSTWVVSRNLMKYLISTIIDRIYVEGLSAYEYSIESTVKFDLSQNVKDDVTLLP